MPFYFHFFKECFLTYSVTKRVRLVRVFAVAKVVSGKLPPRKIAPRSGSGFGLGLALELGLGGGNFPREQFS